VYFIDLKTRLGIIECLLVRSKPARAELPFLFA
jgi:hypothetical protein